ncbi:MAG: hypothetical protein GY720_03600 [bacterium]|nr:hypothetical protein [bacterium]
MPDTTRRTRKRVAKYLDAGELLEVAVLCEPKGTYGLGMFKLAALPGLGQRAMNRSQEEQIEAQVGMVEDFPAKPCIMAVSATRFYTFPSNGLQFKPPTMVVQRSQVKIGEIRRRGMGRVVAVVFSDGSAIEVDVQIGQPLDKLAAILGAVAPIR